MARPWSARCYGVARPREGSRQNSIGVLGRAFTPAFRAGSLSLGAWVPKNLPRRNLEIWFRPARCCSTGSGRPGFRFNDFGAPRLPYLFTLAREGADGQAVVCPLLRGSSPTTGVAPKQHRGLGRAFSPAFRAGSLSLGAWVPKNLPRRNLDIWFRPARCCSTGRRAGLDLDLMILAPRLPYLFTLAREGADGQAVVCPLLRGSSPTTGVAPKQHRVLGRAFSPAFRAGSLYPLARGCRRIWRGEIWKYGFGRRDAARGIGPPGRWAAAI